VQGVGGATGPVEAEGGRWVRVGVVQERAGRAGLGAMRRVSQEWGGVVEEAVVGGGAAEKMV